MYSNAFLEVSKVWCNCTKASQILFIDIHDEVWLIDVKSIFWWEIYIDLPLDKTKLQKVL